MYLPMFITREFTKILRIYKQIEEEGSSWKTRARFINVKKVAAESKTKGKKLNPHMTSVIITVRKRLLEFCSD